MNCSNDRPARIQDAPLYHGTGLSSARNILANGVDLNRCSPGYFGTGFYCARDEALARSNYADFCDEDGDEGVVLAIYLQRAARILDLRNETDFQRWREGHFENAIGRPDFPYVMRHHGIDGLYDNSFQGVVIYNPTVIDVIRLCTRPDVDASSLRTHPAG